MKRLAFVILGAILLGALLVRSVTARMSSQARPEFAEIAIRTQEFPPEWRIVRSTEGVADPDDQRHPLNRLNPLITHQRAIGDFLYNYTGYYRDAFFYDERCTGMVGNYLYQYASEEQAQSVAQALIASMQDAGPAVYEIPEGKRVKGWAARFQGKEGGDVHWFVGTRGNVLILLVVDGPPGCFREGFLQLVEHLLTGLTQLTSNEHLRGGHFAAQRCGRGPTLRHHFALPAVFDLTQGFFRVQA